MATPGFSSCVRCNRPLALDSQSGVCEECLRTGGTPASTSVAPAASGPGTITSQPPKVAPDADQHHTTRTDADHTATPQPHGHARRTLTNDPAYLPEAPPGYDLLRCLGSGGMGSVYLAFEHATERHIAIKFLHAPTSGTAFDRFLIEVRALAELRHENIINVLHVELNWREPYFTMDYAAGGTLADLVRSEGTQTPREAARLVRGAADALVAAHAKSILHRDIKPSNVLLFDSTVPGRSLPRVSDFGLAKRTDREDELTRTGPLGTPSYMSPEAAAGRVRELTPAADVYGLGATLFHLLTGRPPLTGDSNEQIIGKVLKEAPPRLRTLRSDVPAELEAIAVKCLEKDPAARYATAKELSDDLGRFLDEKPVAAPVQTPLRRTQRWLEWHRSGIAMTILGGVVVAALIAIGMAMAPKPKPPVDPQQAALAEYKRELAAGRPVTLLGATGEPRYFRWQLGGAPFVKAANSDDACSYRIPGSSLLELLDDPGIDDYRISLTIRQLERGMTETTADCGLYFSHGYTRGAEKTSTDSCFCVLFKDRDAFAQAGKPPSPQPVRFIKDAIFHQPDVPPKGASLNTDSILFDPAQVLPGYWRGIEVEVRPQRIRAYWKSSETDEPREILRTNGRVLVPEVEYAKLPPIVADPRIVVPKWSPRMAMGIFVRSCGVAIKNITVTPLVPPKE